MRIGSTPYLPPFRALDVQVATLERLQAAGFASSPTNVPVKPVSDAPGETHLRRVSAHTLDIRV